MKKVLSILLALSMLLSVFLIGCGDNTKDTPVKSDPSETPLETPLETPAETPEETPSETPAETPSQTPDEPTEPKYDSAPVSDGTLWYYEDFEGCPITEDNGKAIRSVGWKLLHQADGAPHNNFTRFAIREHNLSRALYIENYTPERLGDGSYTQILSNGQFKFLHQYNYTYQYDITYTDVSVSSLYINLISEYDGSFYNSFHLRSSGYGNNECYVKGDFVRYAVAVKDENSVITKLFGKTCNTSVSGLKNLTVSIRYVVDWENGNKIYARSVDGTTGAKGEWILVSQCDLKQPGAEYIDPQMGGAAIVLKVSGALNGYIDNIIIWAGTGDEPADKSNPYLTSDAECHRLVSTEKGDFCALCGKTEEAAKWNWCLDEIPVYEGGTPANDIYLAGQGIDKGQSKTNENKMQPVSGTTAEEFSAYLAKLEKAGYVREYYREVDKNIFTSYVKDTIRVYTYFMSRTGVARVIMEPINNSASLSDFGYEYEKKPGDTTVLYQYAMAMRDATHLKDDGYYDNGMLYIIKLADNSVIIIDGGRSQQFPDSQCDNLMRMLREITGTPDGGTVRIAAWYVTHAHIDHFAGFKVFVEKYSAYLDLERLFFGFPSVNSPNETLAGGGTNYKAIINVVNTCFADDNTEFLRIHTGQTFSLADVDFEVIYTHEDAVNVKTSISPITSYNDSCAVIRITVDGETFLFMGDAQELVAMGKITENWSNEYLVSDGIQLAHHVLNDLSPLYKIVKAEVVLVPQSQYRINEHKTAPKPFAAAKTYAREGMIFFQNEYTVGIAVVDGQWNKVYTLPVVYEVRK